MEQENVLTLRYDDVVEMINIYKKNLLTEQLKCTDSPMLWAQVSGAVAACDKLLEVMDKSKEAMQ
jgi:hypothetical protein